jgi:hypothetical protein
LQLDTTRIAIRERSFLDILDLSLRVLRTHALPLVLTFLLGALPMALLNYWLLAGYLADPELEAGQVVLFLWWNTLLVIWETPLACAATTLYLGQALFEQKPDAGRIAKQFLGSLPQLIVFQVLLRGVLTFLVITWLVLYIVRPYLNEIILLERNPWRKPAGGGTSTFGRSSALHGRIIGDLFARWLGALVLGLVMMVAFWLSIWLVQSQFIWQEEYRASMFTVALQVAIWSVTGYFTVVRFLSYLDLRIRTEGWEVELVMRAEAARLTRQLT